MWDQEREGILWHLLKKGGDDGKINSRGGEKGKKSERNQKGWASIKKAAIGANINLKVGLIDIKSENSKDGAVNLVDRGVEQEMCVVLYTKERRGG